jgi:ubiquinone biosynthesis protein COQ9
MGTPAKRERGRLPAGSRQLLYFQAQPALYEREFQTAAAIMTKKNDPAQSILDAALELAQTRHWGSLGLNDVADAAHVSLGDIRAHFPDKESLADAWFDRADRAMLETASEPAFLALGVKDRVHRLIMSWLDVLAPHQRVTAQMIVARLGPGNLRVQIPAMLRVGRTVQWLREAAQSNTPFLLRGGEEAALTGIYVSTFCYWMRDQSADQMDTRRFLDRLLGFGNPLVALWSIGSRRMDRERDQYLEQADPARGPGTPT